MGLLNLGSKSLNRDRKLVIFSAVMWKNILGTNNTQISKYLFFVYIKSNL